MNDSSKWKEIERRHALAESKGEPCYLDPQSGYSVFTSQTLASRGQCCGAGCRHCPYAHDRVDLSRRAQKIKRPAWLVGKASSAKIRAISYSGGKDSFLALCRLLQEEDTEELVLLTTFDEKTRRVAIQELSIEDVMAQAQRLDLPLLGVPLFAGRRYQDALSEALQVLTEDAQLLDLSYGDLHLEHVLNWRKQEIAPLLAPLGARLNFPLLHAPYDELIQLFDKSGAQATICATELAAAPLGALWNAELRAALPAEVDSFGERGEFHTHLKPAGSHRELRARLR